jgi:hypothetical protein
MNRLEALGFKQAGQVTELKPLLQKAELSKEQVELVNYYKRNYPLNKFITEQQVKEICYKYNLVCGDVERFKGFVPEKNLREIERFNLKESESDLVKLVNTCVTHISLGYFNRKEFSDRFVYLSSPSYPNKKLIEIAVGLGVDESHVFVQMDSENAKLKICAPVKDMDISGLTLKNGYKLENFIPDPVVLQPVNGGYLILTAWGDEASDPLVVNEINN